MTLRSQGASIFIHLQPTAEPAKTKRTPFALQKDSFCIPKGLVLLFKRTPFATQKDYIFRTTEIRAETSHSKRVRQRHKQSKPTERYE